MIQYQDLLDTHRNKTKVNIKETQILYVISSNISKNLCLSVTAQSLPSSNSVDSFVDEPHKKEKQIITV